MGLDETLSQEFRDAIDMGIFPDTSEGAKDGKGKYPGLKESQFADAANRAFPIDTAEHCRAAMVYLNKYYNNPGAGGVTSTYSSSKFKSVHNKIVKAMKKFDIEHDGCSICKKKSEACDDSKGGKEDMPKDELEADEATAEDSEMEETEADVETEDTDEVVVDESVEASEEESEEETEASEEDTSEAEATTEEVVDEEPLEDEMEEAVEASEGDDTIITQLKNLGGVIDEIISNLDTAEATEESEELSEVDMLTKELAAANEKLRQYEIAEAGNRRIAELAQAGITFAEETVSAKIMRLGAMTDEEFESYSEDLLSVKRTVASEDTEEEAEMEEATASTKEEDGTPTVPPFFLPNVESPAVKDSKDKFKKIYNK